MTESKGHDPVTDARMSPPNETSKQQQSRYPHQAPSAPLLPPPRPARLHSYHHPVSASYSSGSSFLDRHRPQPPPSLSDKEQRSPLLEHRSSDSANKFSRVLPPLSGSPSGYSPFALPSISSNLPSSASWDDSESGREYVGSYYSVKDSSSNDPQRGSSRDQKLPSLSQQFANYNESRSFDSTTVLASPTSESSSSAGRKSVKAHVSSACLNCKRAHLACDVGRPCRRCVNLGKSDTCVDVQHKKRGRPRLKDRPISQSGATSMRPYDHTMTASPSSESGHFRSYSRPSDASFAPQSPAGSVVHVAGMTHGTGVHHRLASTSVSASSYPYSRPDHRPDHLRYPSDRSAWSNGQQRSPNLQTQSQSADVSVSAVVTAICSTTLQQSRVSEECIPLLGYHPTELVDRSLFELVHPSDSPRLKAIWNSLIDPVGVVPQAAPVSVDRMMSISPSRLMTPAAGTIFLQENIRLRQRSGMYDFYSVRLHLGGGLGVDLYQRDTLDRAYIVASLLKLGNDADHPDPALLRMPNFQEDGHGREFRTPTSTRASSPAKKESGHLWSASRPAAELVSAAQRSVDPDNHKRHRRAISNGDEPYNGNGASNSARAVRLDYDSELAAQRDSLSKRSSMEVDGDKSDDNYRAAQRSDPSRKSAHYLSAKSTAIPPPPVVQSLISGRSSASIRDVISC